MVIDFPLPSQGRYRVRVHWYDERANRRTRAFTLAARHIDEACELAERLVRDAERLVPRGLWTEAEGTTT